MKNKMICILIFLILLITNISASAVITKTNSHSYSNSINDNLVDVKISTMLFNDPCIAPDNGYGSVNLPADCPYTASVESMFIIEGLPIGTTIELDPIFDDFINIIRIPGGSLGGEILNFDATIILDISGTGDLLGFSRNILLPVSIEIHTGPHNPGDPIQMFPSELFQLTGEIFGDPDFCSLMLTAGTDYGLPSPGQYTLTRLPTGDFNVDSFFDITYQIEFEGCPGSILEGMAGTTTGTLRIQQGITLSNYPPNKPIRPSGETNGKPGIEYEYASLTSDPDGDDIFYKFDWGDGDISIWLGPYNSSDHVIATHTWTSEGEYEIKVKAKDENDAESEWSDPLSISMPKSKSFNNFNPWILRLINRFPFLRLLK